MPRELLILRHGKSDWSQPVSDFDRPVKDRGKRDAQRMGIWLADKRLLPDAIISSPAMRAITTAEKCAKCMGLDASRIEQDPRIYEASSNQLVQVLQEHQEDTHRTLLVGHNPGLELLLDYLSAVPVAVPEDGKILPTATLARLVMPDDWSQLSAGCAQLVSLTRPAELPRTFPFTTASGIEQRPRPAYYYSQSSVIPYRFEKQELQILLISSSKQKHWVVPKGIQEPGKTAQQSAAKEAAEEAGIRGNVGEQALGSYEYEKWGGGCTVSVYPMEVTEVIPEQEWPEAHRGRRWVTPAEAIKKLKQKALVPLIEKLAQQLTKGGS